MAERAKWGCLVLGTRHWVRGLRREAVHCWLQDIGPEMALLEEVQAKRTSLLAKSGKRAPFRRNRLTEEARQEWDTFWFGEFAPRYRRGVFRLQECRVVMCSDQHSDSRVPGSPLDYVLSMGRGDAGWAAATILCCEPAGEECHRHLFSADALAIQTVRSCLARDPRVRIKVRMRREVTAQTLLNLEAITGVRGEGTPYAHLGPSSLYGATIHRLQDAIAILELPFVESIEAMLILSPSSGSDGWANREEDL